MYKTIKTKLRLSKHENQLIRVLCHEAKNLYNCALYNVRQHYFETSEYLSYSDNYHLLKNTEHYKMLNSSLAQSVIKKVDEAMKAFFGSLKSNKANKVRLPKYLDKNGFYPLIDRMVYKPNSSYYVLPRSNFIKRISKFFDGTSIKERRLLSSLDFKNTFKDLNIIIETPKCILNHKIKEITIKPKFDGQYIEVIHTFEIEDVLEVKEAKKTETMGIDLGYVNLATCAVTNGNHLLIDGKKLKSYNQWYAKRMAQLQSSRTIPSRRLREIQSLNNPNDVKRNKKTVLPYTKKMISLELKRSNRMTYGINKAAKLIMNHAMTNNVGLIIIGWNEGFKDIKVSKQNNQWFKSIPLGKLKDRISYLAKQHNIECKVITEEYTSQASYLDGDVISTEYKHNQVFSGYRDKRGLYVTKKGKKINADLNAALNMIMKSNPNTERLGFSGVNTPKRTYLF